MPKKVKIGLKGKKMNNKSSGDHKIHFGKKHYGKYIRDIPREDLQWYEDNNVGNTLERMYITQYLSYLKQND